MEEVNAAQASTRERTPQAFTAERGGRIVLRGVGAVVGGGVEHPVRSGVHHTARPGEIHVRPTEGGQVITGVGPNQVGPELARRPEDGDPRHAIARRRRV